MTRAEVARYAPPTTTSVVLPVSEVFGPTWQGEGPHTGRRVAFVRLGLCNLSCSWCDTPYTWDTSRYDVQAECPDTPVTEIHKRLEAIGVDTVVLSGGEPLMHHQRLPALMTPGWRWHVESNATILPPWWWPSAVEHTTLSPKVSTDDPRRKRLKPSVLEAWARHGDHHPVAWKFVVTSLDDAQLETIRELQDTHGIPDRDIWVMPEGTTAQAVLDHHRALAETILTETRWNTTTRLHTLLWGHERGR